LQQRSGVVVASELQQQVGERDACGVGRGSLSRPGRPEVALHPLDRSLGPRVVFQVCQPVAFARGLGVRKRQAQCKQRGACPRADPRANEGPHGQRQLNPTTR
jgi:hypothetical protein